MIDWTPFHYPAIAVVCAMASIFLIALRRHDNSIVDVAWGPGFLLCALIAGYAGPGWDPFKISVTSLVAVWAVRLAIRIWRRNRGRPEDFRYAQWRREWGKWFVLRSLFQVYVLQGVLMLAVASPVIMLNSLDSTAITATAILGIMVWCIGFYFEAVGDAQLDRFLADKGRKKKVMDEGLWRYTRHPNYFGEATMWWGIGLASFAAGVGPWAFVGPAIITYLLLFVSGVPMLEKKMMQDPEFRQYAAKTNVFIPWFPRR